jgi:hypothetical protein
MERCLNGLYCVHLELTSRCNKNCWMCGKRKVDRECQAIAMNYGDATTYYPIYMRFPVFI